MELGKMRARMTSILLSGAIALCLSAQASTIDLQTERTNIEQWRAKRLASLTSDTGWLTLAGLFWLQQGENTFGRAKSNAVVLDNPALADTAGSFVLTGKDVRFIARSGSGVTHEGQPVTSIDLVSDAKASPTVLESGSLRFFIIERAGNIGVRARDLQSPRRKGFRGLEYFPIAPEWVFNARFEPYQPHRHIKIVNILGMEEDMDSPGAIVFTKNGQEFRLDAVLENPDDKEFFIMFADGTSGHETYGAGRFMYIAFPTDGKVLLDFNKSYNPPCAFNDFATCPLPPYQNRLKVRIQAGEKKYAGSEH